MSVNTWWLCSQTVVDAMQVIIDGTLDPDPLINSGVAKLQATDGMRHFALFKSVTKDSKQWSVANVYGVTQEETDAFLAKWPNDIELGGCWRVNTGVAVCAQHADLLQYMPDVCHARDQEGLCTDLRPATELTDVVKTMGQHGRGFSA